MIPIERTNEDRRQVECLKFWGGGIATVKRPNEVDYSRRRAEATA